MSNSNGTIETDIGAPVNSDNNTESSSSASSSTSGGGTSGGDEKHWADIDFEAKLHETSGGGSERIRQGQLDESSGIYVGGSGEAGMSAAEMEEISEEAFHGGRKVRGGGSVRNLFNQLDKNGNGKLEKKELARALKKLGYNNNQIKALIKRYDTNKDGRLNLKEFTKMIKSNKSIGRKTRGGSRKGGSRKGGSRKGGSRKGGRRVGGTRKGGRRVGGSRKVRGGRSVRA